jgi:predicted esterase
MQHAIRFEQEARYFTLGQPSAHPAWLVCHGYGQLAAYFIRHFQPLADTGHYIVAPEGLSRFYLQNSSGRVGASWMTRETRETDIANYLRYLDAVVQQSGLAKAPELNLFGFSQGVATICRWAMHTQLPFKRLVLWAGVFPPDVSPELSSSRLSTVALYQVWGSNDPYLNAEKLREQTSYLQSLKAARFHTIRFEGAHSLDRASLLHIASDKTAS